MLEFSTSLALFVEFDIIVYENESAQESAEESAGVLEGAR